MLGADRLKTDGFYQPSEQEVKRFCCDAISSNKILKYHNFADAGTEEIGTIRQPDSWTENSREHVPPAWKTGATLRPS
jgi:hypothetical protein